MQIDKLYSLNDMVKVGCHGCQGCSDCCQDMGQSILLDPHDIYILSGTLEKSFEELMVDAIELHAEEGLILPNLKMIEKHPLKPPVCCFLNAEGRCDIHENRPGICRLFPLGRSYSPDKVEYFLVENSGCPVENRTKMKVSKWIEADSKAYQQFLVDWHNLTKQMRAEVLACEDEKLAKQNTMMFLQLFYVMPYDSGDFYQQFYERRAKLL